MVVLYKNNKISKQEYRFTLTSKCRIFSSYCLCYFSLYFS